MNDKRLIEMVRTHMESNKASSMKYTSYAKKDYLWKDILNQSGPASRNRWMFLRDQFRKTKRIAKSGQSPENTRKRKHADQMSLLRSFLHDRQLVTNIQKQSVDTESVYRAQGYTASTSSDRQDLIPREGKSNERAVSLSSTQILNQDFSGDDLSKTCSSKTISRKLSSSTLLNYIIEKHRNKVDPLDVFFNGVCATVKQMSPYYQNIAKSKIFSIVTEIEMNQIMETNGILKENLSSKVMTQLPKQPKEEPLNLNIHKNKAECQLQKKASALNINIPSSLYNLQPNLSYDELTDDLTACFHSSAPSCTKFPCIRN